MSSSDEFRPLLREHRNALKIYGSDDSAVSIARRQTRRFLTSKTGHYAVLLLVSLDVSSIFADFVVQLLTCDGKIPEKDAEKGENVLGIIGIVFSCLFMAELLASIWAFGFQFFRSKFHCFDAFVILAGFIVDVCLKGIVEEAAELVIVLRLWRVFKIIEELGAGAQEQMESMQERFEDVEKENKELKGELNDLRTRLAMI